MTRAAALLLLVACGDPGIRCPQGTDVTWGTSCAESARAIAIDGSLADWRNVPAGPRNPSAGAGDVLFVHPALTSDGQLALYLETSGVPMPAPYSVELHPLTGPDYTFVLSFTPSAATAAYLDNPVSGFPLAAAFGDTGIEVAAPIDALPFRGGVSIVKARIASDSSSPPTSGTCWDKQSPLCTPSDPPAP